MASATTPREDPFAGIEDEVPSDPSAVRAHFLKRARRTYAEIHKDFVQLPRGERGTPRGSVLAELVNKRRENALNAFLMVHSLTPVLQRPDAEPLPLQVWARLLSAEAGPPLDDTAVSKMFTTLTNMKLITRETRGQRSAIAPLSEDGSGATWARPGKRPTWGQGYFILPDEYWLDGYFTKLRMPGKAMLLILLADTQAKPSTVIPIERAQEWYGVSERTAERGYRELDRAGLLLTKRQKVANPEVSGGFHFVYHRALSAPFSTEHRRQLQKAARTAGDARRAAADTSVETGGESLSGTT